ncbi:small metal-binding protein SmbP [Nitrosomonas sp. Nm166]|uniref:small metal-binding protein SmbP n=1 Tax=Nitrosomonas sp. Nm166 TaxID=1881054 RepID=UPI0008E21D0A|nr:small metal-binding protein SmbP [Nitrosomonas sp. Nm166]SFF20213.1 Small metal-binding protein [Nitrosomonas sp. Nm166]
MRNIFFILTTVILILFLSSEINASGEETKSAAGISPMTEAIKHAEIAQAHKAHAEHIRQHAKMSLEYVKKAEIEAIEYGNTKGRVHITESIRHLVEAISHAKIGHTDIASEHITDALEEMRQFTTK